MTNKETHLSRGTTKEGKKVVGHAFPNDDKWYIITEYKNDYKAVDHGGIVMLSHYNVILSSFTEITSPPQKCLGIRDCEGELIFVGDDVEYTNDAGYKFIFTVVYRIIECSFVLKDKGKEVYRSFSLRKPEDMKIIHPTNKEQDER